MDVYMEDFLQARLSLKNFEFLKTDFFSRFLRLWRMVIAWEEKFPMKSKIFSMIPYPVRLTAFEIHHPDCHHFFQFVTNMVRHQD